MPQFNYRARTAEGREVKGLLHASSRSRAFELLRSNGLQPLQVGEAEGQKIWQKTIGGGVGNKELILLSRQLASMIVAGVTVVDGLRALEKQTPKYVFRELLKKIVYDIEGGASFSQAISKYPNVFSLFYLGVVRSGEAAGRLSESLNVLADYLETNYSFTQKVRGALTYPIFVLVLITVVAVLMMTFVMPQLVGLFKEAEVQLPLPTRILVGVTELFRGYWYVMALLILAAFLVFRSYLRTPEGKYAFGSWLLRVPFINEIFMKIYLSRLTSVLFTLFSSDVPVLESLKIAQASVGNEVYHRILTDTANSVKDGAPISTVWAHEPFIPPMLVTMVAVGERTGEVGRAFGEAQRFFRRDVEEILNTIAIFMEPILVILLGVGVAFIVAGVLLPIYNLVLVL